MLAQSVRALGPEAHPWPKALKDLSKIRMCFMLAHKAENPATV